MAWIITRDGRPLNGTTYPHQDAALREIDDIITAAFPDRNENDADAELHAAYAAKFDIKPVF